MRRFWQIVGPLALSVVIVQGNGGVGAILGQPTTGPPTTTKTTVPPTTGPTTTEDPTPPTATVHPDASGTTKEGGGVPVTNKPKKKRPGKLAKTGPGDDAGNFRLILFNGGFLLLMLGAIFFAVRRRLEHREWWRMNSKM